MSAPCSVRRSALLLIDSIGGWLGVPLEVRGAHVALGTEVEAGGPSVGVELEAHSLALPEHPEQ
jgi:hypothetical protein